MTENEHHREDGSGRGSKTWQMAATPLFIQWAWLLDLADGGHAPIYPVGVAPRPGRWRPRPY
jgi:hypothetical protein